MNKVVTEYAIPTLYILRGPSCCGKSSAAKKFVEEAGLDEYNIISSDKFRGYMFGDDTFQRGNSELFKLIHGVLESRFANRATMTIYDATNLSISDTRPVLEMAKKFGINTVIYSYTKGYDINDLMKNRDFRVSKGGMYIPDHVLMKHVEKEKNCRYDFIKYAEENSDWCEFKEAYGFSQYV